MFASGLKSSGVLKGHHDRMGDVCKNVKLTKDLTSRKCKELQKIKKEKTAILI